MKRKILSYIILFCLISIMLHPCTAYATVFSSSVKNVAASNMRTGDSDFFLSRSNAELLVGSSFDLEVFGIDDEEISYKSEDSSIASIESSSQSKCVIHGNAVGNTIITVKIKGKSSFFLINSTTTLRCNVSVTPTAVSIKIKKKQYKLLQGQKKRLGVILRPSITIESPIYTSSNRSVVTVSKKGRLNAKSAGISVITASIKNGASAKCKVIVSNPAANNSSTNKKKNNKV